MMNWDTRAYLQLAFDFLSDFGGHTSTRTLGGSSRRAMSVRYVFYTVTTSLQLFLLRFLYSGRFISTPCSCQGQMGTATLFTLVAPSPHTQNIACFTWRTPGRLGHLFSR